MAKWVLDWHSVLEYPTLGFHAEPGDILDAVYAPDARWSQNADQGAAETVYRFAIGGDPNYIEPTDGHVLTWDATSNRYVPTAPEGVGLTSVDAFVADKVTNDPGSDIRAAFDGRYVGGSSRPAHAPALGLYFPEVEGAAADGVTDDTAAIQATLVIARAAKGRVLLQPSKTYVISATLDPAGTIVDGAGATIKQAAGVTGFPMLQATSAPLVVRDLTLDGNRANTTAPASIATNGAGIYVYRSAGGDMGLVQNVTARNLWGPAVRVGSSRFTDPRDNNRTAGNIIGLRATDCGEGVFLDAARDVKITGCQIFDVDRVGVQDNFGCDNTVTATTVDGVRTGYCIITQYSYGFAAIGNTVRRAGSEMVPGSGLGASGIQVGGGETSYNVAKGFTFSNNLIEDCYDYGISIDPTLIGSPGVVQVTPGTISGNVVSECGLRAYADDITQNGGSGIFLHQCSQVSCTGNVSRGNQRAGIIDDGLDNAVTGNTLISNLDYGIEVRCGSTETKGRGAVGMNAFRGNPTDVFVSQYSIDGDRPLPGSRMRVKTADQTVTNTTTTTLDTHLVFAMVPGYYEISGLLIVDSSGVADFRAGWQVPAGTNLTWTLNAFPTSAASTSSTIYREPVAVTAGSGTVGVTTCGTVASGTLLTAVPRGLLQITTAGTVWFRFAQGTAEATDTILKARSHLRLTRIA